VKVRNGFVSNSSSTSFLIVGIHDQITAEKLAKKDGCKEMGWGGYSEGKTMVFIGNEGGYDDEPYKPDYAGIEAETLLKQNRTVAEIKQIFVDKAALLGITIQPSQVDLHYGECSSE
jgi:hypothetical protein